MYVHIFCTASLQSQKESFLSSFLSSHMSCFSYQVDSWLWARYDLTIMVTAKPVKFVLSLKWLEKAPQAKILENSCKILILWRKKCSFLPVFRVRWLPTSEYITQKYSAISFVVSEHHLVETKSFVFSCTLESSKNFF